MRFIYIIILISHIALLANSQASNSGVRIQTTVQLSAPPLLDWQLDSLYAGIEKHMVRVDGGTLNMGCTAEQGDECLDIEKPAHQVKLSTFYINSYDVSIAQFEAFAMDSGYRTDAEQKGYAYTLIGTSWKATANANFRFEQNGNEYADSDKAKYPVVQISYNDANAFCRWLSHKTGRHFRLPTEAEWEYAARGGNKSKGYKFAGSNNIDTVAWYNFNTHFHLQYMGQKLPNELGLYDMSGNVVQWCSDWYSDTYYAASTVENPKGAPSGQFCVVRGGAWYSNPEACRVSCRNAIKPDASSSYYGFRLVEDKADKQ